MRKRMSKKRDQKVFRHTAVVGKKVNVNDKVSRGGIRL